MNAGLELGTWHSVNSEHTYLSLDHEAVRIIIIDITFINYIIYLLNICHKLKKSKIDVCPF